MKLEWNLSYFDYITRYDDAQRQAIDEFARKLEQGTSQPNTAYQFHWSYEISFAAGRVYVVFNDRRYPLVEVAHTQPTPDRPECYIPFMCEGKVLLATFVQAVNTGHLYKNELGNWQVVFLNNQ